MRSGLGASGGWSRTRYKALSWLARHEAGRDAVLVVPGLLAVGVFAALAAAEGGTEAVSFYPATLGLVLLLAAAVVGCGERLLALPRTTLVALALFTAFVLWSFASVGWADSRGAAWDAATRSLLYLAAFALFAVWPWRARSAAIVLGVYGLAIAVVGLVAVSHAIGADIPARSFVRGRLSDPTGYPNGTAALFVGALWPLIMLSARRDVPWPLRAITLAGAGVLAQLALLAQSRGSLAASAVALVLYLVLVPHRARAIAVLVAVGAALAWSWGPLMHVFSTAQRDNDLVGGALQEAQTAIYASAAVLLALGVAAGLIDRHVELPRRRAGARRKLRLPRPSRLPAVSRRGLLVVAAALVLAAGTVGTVAFGDTLDRAVEEFTAGATADGGTSHFSDGLRTERTQFWGVAMGELAKHPLTGIGAGNFAIAYTRERDSVGDEPRDAHSFPVELASQTGIVGLLLLGGLIVAALLVARRAWGAGDSLQRAVTGVALVGFGYWFAHASGDWLWALPAVAAPAFAWLGLAAGLQRPVRAAAPAAGAAGTAPPLATHRRPRRGYALGLTAAVVLVVAATASATIRPWIAAENVDFAERIWRTDLDRAYAALHDAHDLNPYSDEADILEGTIASRRGERRRAREAFARAVQRTPDAWYPVQQLGIEEALIGHLASGLADLERARRLNPLEVTTRDALTEVRAGRRPSPAAIRAALLARICGRVPSAEGCARR